MAHVKWTHEATQDFDTICNYLEEHGSVEIRTKFASHVTRLIEELRAQPYLGSEVQDSKHHDLRERLYQKYRIFYRVRLEIDAIEIVTIIHGARLLPDSL